MFQNKVESIVEYGRDSAGACYKFQPPIKSIKSYYRMIICKQLFKMIRLWSNVEFICSSTFSIYFDLRLWHFHCDINL